MSVLTEQRVQYIIQRMAEHPWQLWFLMGNHLCKTHVSGFSEAHQLACLLKVNNATGIRIARHCEANGCEVVLHKFK